MRAVLNNTAPNPTPLQIVDGEAVHEVDDSQLVRSHLDGDQRAFGTLVDRYQTRLVNFVNRMIRDYERSEDLVQETFIRVHRHVQRFDQTRKFSTWVYTIASNLAKNELRDRRRNPLLLFQAITQHWKADHRALQFEDSGNRPDDLYHKRFLKEAVEECVGRLSLYHRTVFVLRELEGKSYGEIADILGCSLGTVKSRLNRARAKFARSIAPLLA